MTEPCHLSAVEARRLIGRRKLSPVELLESCLARIRAANPAINAVVAIDEVRALADARGAERAVMRAQGLGELHGLPVGIKDLHPVAGLRSTWGSLLFKDFVPLEDDLMVANIRLAGANPFCKTNVPEFGAGGNSRNLVYGVTGNPFAPTLTAAGSSGGSAAALALDMMPLATGSDYGGSLRTPAGYCGVVGFRPSPGVVPNPDKIAGLIPWGVLGPMGRTVEDAYLLLRAMLDVHGGDPFSSGQAIDWPEVLLPADLAAIRAAISPDLGVCPVSKAIRAVFKERTRGLGDLFLAAEDTAPDFSGVHEIFEVHRGLAFVAGHQEKLARHRDLLDRNIIDNTERGLELTAAEIGRGFVEQTALTRRVDGFFDDFDVVITPTAAVSPFPHGELFVEAIDGTRMPTYMTWLAIAYAPTMALCCSAVIPCGLDAAGLPFGLQVFGPRGSDLTVLSVALALEQVFAGSAETRRPVPKVSAPLRSKAAAASKARKAPR
jgi:Asp-tRNA(Asn)/Glu-tRNA(Gln) amidotransferase A subunit family amidase